MKTLLKMKKNNRKETLKWFKSKSMSKGYYYQINSRRETYNDFNRAMEVKPLSANEKEEFMTRQSVRVENLDPLIRGKVDFRKEDIELWKSIPKTATTNIYEN
jgi:hypothetical protein